MYKLVIVIITLLLLFSCITLKKPLPINNNIKVQCLDDKVNSEKEDYSPCLLPNDVGFLFVSDRPGSLFNSKKHKISHDIWIAVKQNLKDSLFQVVSLSDKENVINVNLNLNTNDNEGSLCFSSDFTKMYFTGCYREDGYGSCDIYEADIKILKRQILISNIKNLGQVINSEKWESLPSISPDNKTLYFVSNRNSSNKFKSFELESDGLTMHMTPKNVDIFFSNYDENKKQWLPAEKLSETINSNVREYSPLICPDNKTLIFASKGHEPNGGGFDLFYSKTDSAGNWSEPVNFGSPMNSENDDAFLTLSPDGESGYFSSKRKWPYIHYDIYKVNLSSILDDVRIISWRQDSTADVVIAIYNESREQIHTIERKSMTAGIHSFIWDGKDTNGLDLKAGKYAYQVFVGDNAPGLPRLLWIKQKN